MLSSVRLFSRALRALPSATLLLAFACSDNDSDRSSSDAGLGSDAASSDAATDATITSDAGDGGSRDDAGDGSVLAPPPPRPDVHVRITADNAYAFGYGTASEIESYRQGVEDGSDGIFVCSASCTEDAACGTGMTCDEFGTCNGDRKGPETYVVPGEDTNPTGYLYIVVWSDESITQGALAQFETSDGSGNVVYTGSDRWEVCATGHDVDPGSDAMQTTFVRSWVNGWVAKCNQGVTGATYSRGWLGGTYNNNPSANPNVSGAEMGLVVSGSAAEASSSNRIVADSQLSQNFRERVCRTSRNPDKGDAIDDGARWMWFDENLSDAVHAFTSNGNARGDFLIFRLPMDAIIIN